MATSLRTSICVEHMEDPPAQETGPDVNNTTVPTLTVSAEDPPPKYTPPPSYTTATGARIAKFFRQSLRRSVRRIANVLGEGSSRQRPTAPVQVPPPDYSVVLNEINHRPNNDQLSSAHVINIEPNQSTFSRELAHSRTSSVTLTIADVASILRNSFRRSRIRVANHLKRNATTTNETNSHSSLSAENLVESAAPIGETSLVLENLSIPEVKPTNNNLSSVI